MKLIILAVVALVAVAAAAPVDQQQQVVPIIRSDFDQQPNGGYVFGVETGDGTKRDETGEVKSIPDEENKPQEVVIVRGSYSYVDPEGKTHTVNYYADETGFHAEGDDVPKAA